MAVDPRPPKAQRPLTLCVLLQMPQICAEVLSFTDVNAKEDLARTPPEGFRYAMKTKCLFNDFEMAENSLGGPPNVAKGPPSAPQSFREMAQCL